MVIKDRNKVDIARPILVSNTIPVNFMSTQDRVVTCPPSVERRFSLHAAVFPSAHARTLGHLMFAIGITGLGLLSAGSGDFAYTWQPVPNWVPWRQNLAYASGVLLLVLGIGMLVRRVAKPSAWIATVYLGMWVVLLHAPHVLKAPASVGAWLGVCENLLLVCGGWTLLLSLYRFQSNGKQKLFTDSRVPQFLFGASCVVFGMSHFAYVNVTAGMVPAWLPHRVFFVYLTATAHLCAGFAVLSRILARLAASLEAVMISLFVLLVHIPAVYSAHSSRLAWTMLFVATAFAGSSWLVAGSFRESHVPLP